MPTLFFKQRKNIIFNVLIFGFLTIIIFIGLFFVNKRLKVSSVNITFFDQNKENNDIQNITENIVKLKGNTLLGYIFLDRQTLTKRIHDEFPVVETVQISKNINMSVNLVITKNEKFFSTCMDSDQFLVKCSFGNQNGIFYQEVSSTTKDILNIQVVEDAIYDSQSETQIENPDSISLNRIYTKSDFANLRELINYFKKSYDIQKVEVGKLKIAKIYLNDFYIVVDMSNSFINTTKDFELIARTGELKDYLNDKPKDILYVDLSFKNKIFYKLREFEKDTKNDIMSTSTATSTATNTNAR